MVIAFIPARMGSKRIPMKNIRTLGGHPLIAYAIQAAKDAMLFDGIYVSTDSARIGEIAEYYGVKYILRPDKYATDDSPDAEWIEHALEYISTWSYAIIRPTSPFRTGETINRAWIKWDKASIMKAVEPVKQHPAKMWKVYRGQMNSYTQTENHLCPTQTLNMVYVQNGSLEFRPRYGRVFEDYQSFFTEGNEGFDLNTPNDWILAEALIEKGYAKLPQIDREAYDFTAV